MKRFGCGLEVKFAEGAEAGTFTGYGAVFGNVDSHGDVIQKGAFRETLRDAKKSGEWPAMLLQHGSFLGGDDDMPVGIWTEMKEDDRGLHVEGKLADTQRGRDAYALLKMTPRPAISGLSIGYIAKEFVLGTKPNEPRRTLKKVELMEVSLVTFPANTLARIDGVKNGMPTERQFEDWLTQDAGFSRSQARTIIKSGFKTLKGMQDAARGEDGFKESVNRLTQLLRSA